MSDSQKSNKFDRSTVGRNPILCPDTESTWVLLGVGEIGEYDIYTPVENLADLVDVDINTIALPISSVLNLPLVLNTSDQSLLRDLIKVQCERNGLFTEKAEESVFDFEVISVEEKRTSVVVYVPAEHALKELGVIDAKHFDVTANIYELPDNAMCFWRESGRLVVVVRRQGKHVYSQALSDDSVTREVVTELRCLQLQLSEMFESDQVPEVHTFGEFSSSEMEQLHRVLNLDVFEESKLQIRAQRKSLDLVPFEIKKIKREKLFKKRLKQAIALGVLAYVGFLCGWILFLGKTAFDIRSAKNSLKKNAPIVAQIKASSDRWVSLQSAINSDYYPLELLARCVQAIKSEGLSLVQFRVEDDQLILQGESEDVGQVYEFMGRIDSQRSLDMFAWSMREPLVRGEGRAHFIIQGVRKNAG